MNYITENSSTHIQYSYLGSIVLSGGDHVVDLKDHLNDLGSELELVPLRGSRLKHTLLVHISSSLAESIDSDEWVLLCDLLLLDLRNVFNGCVARVLSEGERDLFECIRESADCILLDTFNLICLFLDSDRAS